MTGGLRQNKAFTLLELLVAMTLMVVTASCLYTALYTGFRAKRSAEFAVEPTSKALNAIELIKQDTLGILPLGGTLAGSFIGTNSSDTKGMDTDSLEFYTTHIYADDNLLASGLGKIELLLEEDNDEVSGKDREGYKLVRKITTNLLSSKTVDSEEQVLCRDVRSLNLRYYDEEDGWVDEWDSTEDANSLPLALEINIQVIHNEKGSSTNVSKDLQMRRLMQAFAIPCGGMKEESEEASTTSTSEAQTGK
jgi:prepilin-type N-terminal cleavage/methylation domain-containing protein